MTLPGGRTITLPAGVTEERVRSLMAKRRSGEQLTAAEQATLRRVFQGMGSGSGRPGAGTGEGGLESRFAGRYIVFVREGGKPVARNVSTGLTDLDYTEVTSGLSETDSVLVLPSASLVQEQKEFTERVQRMTGGGGIPGMTSQGQSGSKASTTPRGQ
jgi:hypothetical protein